MSETKTKKKNYGKDFEQQVYKNFSEIADVSIDRIPDQVTRYKGASSNVCDFLVYKEPTLLYLECKTTRGNTLPFSNIRENQWEGLLKKSKIKGVKAGIICWWVDKDVTLYIPIQELLAISQWGGKSVRYDIYESLLCDKFNDTGIIKIDGRKKRILFEYDFSDFFSKI